MNGFNVATGEIIIFLDAHTEVNVKWYEPIAVRLQINPKSIIQPFVDGINAEDLEYAAPPDVHKGAFTWDLRYVWLRVSEHVEKRVLEEGLPYSSITLVGCAIAVNRVQFEMLGAFDEGMQVWGGENIELAFRVWMCGGSVETVPCSRIGHLFKPIPYQKDIKSDQIWIRNLKRIADIWMDDYRKYFYSSVMVYPQNRFMISSNERKTLNKRLALKSKLECHSFEWFMMEVATDIVKPPRGAIYHGEITNLQTKGCWSVKDDGYIDINEICYEHKIMPTNIFTMTDDGLLLYRERCVYGESLTPNLRLGDCAYVRSLSKWSMRYENPTWGEMRNELLKGGDVTCAQHATSSVEPHLGEQMAQTSECSSKPGGDDFQLWSFTQRFDFNATSYYS